MSMKAQIRTDACGNITIHMEGGLNYDSSAPLKSELEELCKTNPSSTITIDMHNLDFVGSSGIGMFVDTIKSLNARKDQIRLMNVKSEFLRVFKLYDYDAMTALIMEFDNDDTDDLSQRFAARGRTFQN